MGQVGRGGGGGAGGGYGPAAAGGGDAQGDRHYDLYNYMIFTIV